MMSDRRQDILRAGLEVLRKWGYSGFTQPRVAAKARLRQSHLTYYFPTRVDLLAAVGRAAIVGQLSAVDKVLQGASPQTVAKAFAKLVIRHENTRVLMSLVQAADQEPSLRTLFHELADGIVSRADLFLKKFNPHASEADARMLHSLLVGLSVINLATGRLDNKSLSSKVIVAALTLLLKESTTVNRHSGPNHSKQEIHHG